MSAILRLQNVTKIYNNNGQDLVVLDEAKIKLSASE